MKKRITTLLLVLISSFAIADTIDINTYLEMLKTKDPEYLNLSAAKEQIKGSLMSATSIYDWQLSGQTSKTLMDEVKEGGSQLDNFNQFSYETSVSKIFSNNATMFSATYGYGSSKMTLPTNTDIKSYKPYVEMNLSQPLLKNADGKIYSYSKDFIEINKKIIDIQYQEMKEAYFAEKINLYLTWILDTKALRITNQHYKNMISLHKQIEKQYKQDYIHETDVLRSREGIELTEDMLRTQLNEWNNTSEKVFSLIGISFTRIDTPDNINVSPAEFNIENISDINNNLRTSKIFDEQKKAAELDLDLAQEKSKLQLDAFANYAMYDSDSKDTGLLGNMDKSDYTIGAQFSIDLEQKDTKGTIKESQEKIKEVDKNKRLFLRNHNVLISQIINRIKQADDSINKYNKIVDMSERRLNLEKQRYNLGKIPYKFLIDTQNEVLNYKQKLLSHNINKQKLNVTYMANNDTLLKYISALAENN